ncbi:MAG: NADP-dependent isocitrate dehydrogenase [Rickettsiaceae bacterium]|nr:NADP-dependent isocitrate dehydrogenase [Rickettsiaceae bacterium]
MVNSEFVPVTVAYGDGIGPEIMQAAMHVLKEAEARIRLEVIEVGEKLYKKNYTSGIASDSWESLERTKVLIKAPITTPQGGGYKSLNVTLRKALGLFANVRPSISYHPFVNTLHPNLDVVIVRENEEDLYAGIEYRHTHNMRESIKLISRTGCEKIVRYAFEYAVKNNRKKVTCFSKDNIMKFSDGIFHQVFDEIAKEYPKIQNEHYIVDIGTARLATKPDIFDVIVTSNLFGDIISDITAEISGSVGLAGSANIGQNYAMFEAIHGSAPDIAGKNIANPSGLINAAVMMLVHIGQGKTATAIENAWKKTIEDGMHTVDIYNEKTSSKKVSTEEFANEVIKRLGDKPSTLKVADYEENLESNSTEKKYTIDTSEKKELVGVDIFVDIKADSADEVATKIAKIDVGNLKLKTIACKGLKLWPRDDSFKMTSDHWCLRFMPDKGNVNHTEVAKLISNLAANNIDFIKVESLYNFAGKRGYSLAQGE